MVYQIYTSGKGVSVYMAAKINFEITFGPNRVSGHKLTNGTDGHTTRLIFNDPLRV